MYNDFADTIWRLVCFDDEEAFAMLARLRLTSGTVRLVEGDLSVDEALAYVRGLHEMGLDLEARELLDETVRTVLGMTADVALPVEPAVGPALAVA